jgi:Tfp pilus assembly protein PilX
MKNINSNAVSQNRSSRDKSRGVALVFTLLILSLMMVLSLGMVIALSSQTFISGYYRNFRGAFYAADSGANVARVAMMNSITGLVPGTVTLGTQPLSATQAATVQANVRTAYAQSWTSLNGGQAAGSWPGKFELSTSNPATFAQSNCHLSYAWASSATPGPVVADPNAGTTYTCATLPPTNRLCSSAAGLTNNCYVINNFQYTYTYTLDVLGQVQNSEQAEILDTGNISITVNISQPSSVSRSQSFAAWGMFIDQSPICNGSTLVNGTLTGPVFTNGSWNFNTGSYIFTDSVGQAGAQAGANFSSGCNPTNSLPSSSSGQTVNPTFNNSFAMSQTHITPPPNSFSQMWAAVDGKGTGETNASPTATDMNNSNMRNASGTQFPTGGVSSGVYLPYVTSGGTLPNPPAVGTSGTTCSPITGGAHPASSGCITGGGIYVKGNATVTMQASTNSGDPVQIFTIVQSGTTTTVMVDLTANITTFTTGGNTKTLTGVPSNLGVNPPTDATMLYVDGNITSLQGAGTASIQDSAAVTVTANGDMTITGNITYAHEPVTMTQNQIVSGSSPACCNGTPADTLIPSNNSGQVLGLFTASGNVNLAVPSNNQNLEIDASIAAIGGTGTGGIVNNGNSINTLNIVGGRIQSTIQNIGATTRNVFFDRRFAAGNFAPPWFPSTTITSTPSGVESSTVSNPTPQRIEWRCLSCQ